MTFNPFQDARGKIWMCDIDGLLTTTRKVGNLEGHKTYYAKDVEPMKELGEVVKKVKPTVIFLSVDVIECHQNVSFDLNCRL